MNDPKRFDKNIFFDLFQRNEIRSPEFYQALLPHLRSRTQHFQHEFYNFARSCYDMVTFFDNFSYLSIWIDSKLSSIH